MLYNRLQVDHDDDDIKNILYCELQEMGNYFIACVCVRRSCIFIQFLAISSSWLHSNTHVFFNALSFVSPVVVVKSDCLTQLNGSRGRTTHYIYLRYHKNINKAQILFFIYVSVQILQHTFYLITIIYMTSSPFWYPPFKLKIMVCIGKNYFAVGIAGIVFTILPNTTQSLYTPLVFIILTFNMMLHTTVQFISFHRNVLVKRERKQNLLSKMCFLLVCLKK